jgi:hypothetical protein
MEAGRRGRSEGRRQWNSESGKLKRMSGVRGQRTDGWMNRMSSSGMDEKDIKTGMVGWEKGRFGDKVIRTDVGDRRSEITGRKIKQFDITIKNTFHLIEKIKSNELPDKILINVHPQRWNDRPLPWVKELVWQNAKNVVKKWMIRIK